MTTEDRYPELTAAVNKASADLFKQFGPESSVIVMIGIPDGEKHSSFRVQAQGRCLQVEGLLVRCAKVLHETLWEGLIGPR